ncbi:helix-turn-helix domain-containing protein [Methylobacterium sp. Leaf113]|uniref:helix-turn-helix domain-containing protein n=1 Tax=Methylobacterium sp. Leaf113 TaxID=1736259 RepID=UPI0009E82CC1
MRKEPFLVPDQCRAARGLIGWSRGRLSERCGVAASTLADFEVGKREPYGRTLADVRRTLEEAGVVFIPADKAGGPGVRLQRPTLSSGLNDRV